MVVLLPDGNRVDLGSVVYKATSSTVITFTLNAGGTFTYTDPQAVASSLTAVLQQLDRFRRYPVQSGLVPQLVAGYYQLSTIQPNQLDVLNAGTINVIGSGFVPTVQLYLCFNDTGGGMDDDPIYFTCTWVSPTLLTAVKTGGASNLSTGALIYLSDAIPTAVASPPPSGHLSNVITGSSVGDSTQIISVP